MPKMLINCMSSVNLEHVIALIGTVTVVSALASSPGLWDEAIYQRWFRTELWLPPVMIVLIRINSGVN